MIATLTLAALAAQQPAQATMFAPKFIKDEVMTYTTKVSGDEGGNQMSFDVHFEVTTTGEAKEGKTPVHIKFIKLAANFGGMEQAVEAEDVDIALDKFGAPQDMHMEGPTSVAFVAMVTQYLPNKAMKVGDKYKADLDLGGAKVALEGVYSGEEDFEGKRYHVLTAKSSLTPTGQEPGTISTKSFYDANLGKVVRTESSIDTPDGVFKMTVTATPKKKS